MNIFLSLNACSNTPSQYVCDMDALTSSDDESLHSLRFSLLLSFANAAF